MADFPRIKWLDIDGQQVPFTEPQHFTGSGDETVRTGKDNPLPVANYTKKGNIWLPVSEENPMPTQVTGSIVELKSDRDLVLTTVERLEVFTANNLSVVEFIYLIARSSVPSFLGSVEVIVNFFNSGYNGAAHQLAEAFGNEDKKSATGIHKIPIYSDDFIIYLSNKYTSDLPVLTYGVYGIR